MHQSHIVDLGTPVHIIDHGGSGQLMILVHGLEGSALNWAAVGPYLAKGRKVIAPDLAGFGITPPGSRGSSVEANAKLVVELIEREDSGPAIVVGNSMGGLVSMLAAVEAPHLVDRMILVDPVLPVRSWRKTDPEVLLKLAGPLLPGVGSQLIRVYQATHSPEEHTKESIAMITAHPESVPPVVWESQLEMHRIRRSLDWAIPAFRDADRSISRYVLNRSRLRKLLHRIAAPTLLIHGAEDRLVSIDSARWALEERPDWDAVIFEDVGHVPMLEVPEEFVEAVEDWLEPAEGRRINTTSSDS
jgi:pimeloyl-ACP methyl ester carboxylesterase